jgi:hypothetical protein
VGARAALHLPDEDVTILNSIDQDDIDLANACLAVDAERRAELNGPR